MCYKHNNLLWFLSFAICYPAVSLASIVYFINLILASRFFTHSMVGRWDQQNTPFFVFRLNSWHCVLSGRTERHTVSCLNEDMKIIYSPEWRSKPQPSCLRSDSISLRPNSLNTLGSFLLFIYFRHLTFLYRSSKVNRTDIISTTYMKKKPSTKIWTYSTFNIKFKPIH